MTAGGVTYQESGALLMPPIGELALGQAGGDLGRGAASPVAFMTLTVNEPRAGAGTTVGLQAALGGAGVIHPLE